MYSRLLVPLDGSRLAEAILPHAKELAQKFGAELILFEAIPLTQDVLAETVEPGAPDLSVNLAFERLRAEREEAERYLGALKQRLESEGIRARMRVDDGHPADAIVRAAEAEQASLIALSTHGRGGLNRLVFGSIADEVIRHSKLPILLLHPNEPSS